jgi:hypothetical protein
VKSMRGLRAVGTLRQLPRVGAEGKAIESGSARHAAFGN